MIALVLLLAACIGIGVGCRLKCRGGIAARSTPGGKGVIAPAVTMLVIWDCRLGLGSCRR